MMEVYNGASRPIVLRTFVANVLTPPDAPIMIDVGSHAIVRGPILREFGFAGPYLMLGSALVRDWGPLQIVPADDMAEITIRHNDRGIFKRTSPLHPRIVEGFVVTFFDDYHLIDSL